MNIAVVTPAQHESLVDLLCDLHAYCRQSDDSLPAPAPAPAREAVQAHLRDHLLAPASPVRLVVAARADGTVVGLVALVVLRPLVAPSPQDSGQCMVKELFVRDQARSEGVGRALMAWAARFALEQGCARMDWNVMATNHRGIAFYEGLGAGRVVDRLSYRLGHNGLHRLGAADAAC